MDLMLPYETYSKRYPHKMEALYHALKDAVTEQRVPYGTRLPSSRELAKVYGLSRGTVNAVYETLASEGYLLSRVGHGTTVCYSGHRNAEDGGELPRKELQLSEWGRRVQSMPLRTSREWESHTDIGPAKSIRFELGVPDMRLFPYEQWNKHLYAEVRELGVPYHKEPFQAQGSRELREAVAAYLNRNRGLCASAEHVVIVNGSMQAIALLSQLLVNPGDGVAVENPGYSGTRRAVAAQGGTLLPIPAGQVTADRLRESYAKLLYVSPGRQFPTGLSMSLQHRLELLDWAAEGGYMIVEDDYDSEFRHRGRPLEPLKALDRSGSVAYIGTFSKTMPPSHRLGYAVLPPELVEVFTKAKQLYEPHPTALLEQRAMARFMNGGHYERHLRRMKRIYGARYHRLKQELELKPGLGLEHTLSDCWECVPSDSGLHLFAWWKGTEQEWADFQEACRESGVYWTEADSYFYEGQVVPSACFGFSHLTEDDIAEGAARMREAWRSIKRTAP